MYPFDSQGRRPCESREIIGSAADFYTSVEAEISTNFFWYMNKVNLTYQGLHKRVSVLVLIVLTGPEALRESQ